MKFKHLLAAALLFCTAGAWAQTDVTSTYLTNADFSQGTPVTVGVCTYAADKSKNGTNYANLVSVDGWTAVSSADGKAGGLFAIGGGAWLGGTGFTAPATDSDGNTGVNVLGIVTCWSASVQYTQTLKSALPAGTYTLVLAAYNSGAGQNDVNANYIGFVEEGGTTHYATTKKYNSNTWKYEFITFTLSAETSGYVSLGYKSTGTGSGNMPHLFISGLQLFEGEVDAAAYEAAKEAARNAKELAANKEKLAGSSPTNPSADLLVNGSFDTNNYGWTLNNMGYQQNGERPTRYVEKWNGSALTGSGSVSQTVKNIPAGAYVLKGTVNAQLQSNQALEITGAAINVNATSVATSGVWKDYTVNYVHENDGDISVSFAYDNTNANWVSADGFSLVYVGSYVAMTSITADDVTLEQTKTAEIGAVIVPANASFPALTYASADEAIATVDANGVVTGVAVGNTTITITSAEATKTINVTVTAPTYVPESITLSSTDFAFDKDNVSAQLTASITPAQANQAVTYVSSNPSVATVDGEGNINAISTGTAVITVKSVIDENIHAEANVTVAFPEGTVPAQLVVINGSAKTTTTLNPTNLFKNGSFEYPNGVGGWKTVGYTTDAVASDFTITAEGGIDNGAFVTTNGSGAGSAKTIRQAVPVEAGKKYYFAVYTSGKAPSADNFKYNALFQMTDATTEDGVLKEFEWPQGASQTSSEWAKTEFTFTADDAHPFVGVRMGWNESSSFDNFILAEITDETTVGNVQYALDAIPTANIGNGVFQYKQSDIDAVGATALVDGVATVSDVEAAYDALKAIELNAPADGQLFNIILTADGWTYDQKAMTYIASGRADAGNYAIQYKEAANTNLAQAFTFTKDSGNGYKLSQIDADGNARYICTGVTYGGNTSQIRTTTDADQALVVTVIPTATEGKWNLKNTAADQYIGSQDNGVFTVNSHIDFNIVETTKPSIAISTSEAGWGTTFLPFAVAALPTGVKAYTCAAVDVNTLTLVEVDALEANKPYIIEGSWNETLKGDAQGTALTNTVGLLTGTYVDYTTVGGEYVMQKQDDKVGFFQVGTEDTDAKPVVPANHAYLTVSSGSGVKAFFLGDTEDAIKSVFDGVAAGEVYDLSGRKVTKLQRGVNIVNGKKVIVK